MSEYFSERRSDIARLLATHYAQEHHRLSQAVIEAEAEIANSPHRIEHGIKGVKADEQRHLGVLRAKIKGFERELVELAAERDPLERELSNIRSFLESTDATRDAEQGLGRDTG